MKKDICIFDEMEEKKKKKKKITENSSLKSYRFYPSKVRGPDVVECARWETNPGLHTENVVLDQPSGTRLTSTWSARWESNPEPSRRECDALLELLRAPVGVLGVEPRSLTLKNVVLYL